MRSLKIYGVDGDKEVLRFEMIDDTIDQDSKPKRRGLTIQRMLEKGMIQKIEKDQEEEE
jgi:hypothetical protein